MKNTKFVFTVLDLTVEATRKDIKYLHISVHPPTGKIIVSAPLHFRDDEIRNAVAKRLKWIRKHQRDLRSAKRETAREMVNGESHYLWGKRYLLEVLNGEPRKVIVRGKKMEITASVGTDRDELVKQLYSFYRAELRKKASPLVEKYELALNLSGAKTKLLKMKTLWGSFSQGTNTILLNIELAKHDPKYLEHIIAHELCHALTKRHDENFYSKLDRLMPNGSKIAEELQSLTLILI